MRMLWVLWVLLAAAGMVEAAGVRLDWDYTQGSIAATKFRMYRQPGCAGAFAALTPDIQPVTSTPATYTFQDMSLVVGQNYCYQVVAVDATGKESGPSKPPVTFQVSGVLADPTNLRGTLIP